MVSMKSFFMTMHHMVCPLKEVDEYFHLSMVVQSRGRQLQ